MKCSKCGTPTVSTHQWYTLGQRPPGHLPRGRMAPTPMCRPCYQRLRNEESGRHDRCPRCITGTRELRPREEVLEDYAMIRDDVTSVHEAAHRMGMSFAALDRALYRARQDGDRRALPPLPQLERGIKYGPSRHLIQEAS